MQRWMLSVMGDARAFALLEWVLKVLQALPFVMDTLKGSGVARTVREIVVGHPQRDMRRIAEAVVVHWLQQAEQEDGVMGVIGCLPMGCLVNVNVMSWLTSQPCVCIPRGLTDEYLRRLFFVDRHLL